MSPVSVSAEHLSKDTSRFYFVDDSCRRRYSITQVELRFGGPPLDPVGDTQVVVHHTVRLQGMCEVRGGPVESNIVALRQ